MRTRLTLQFAGSCPLQFLQILPYIARTQHHIIVHSTTVRNGNTLEVECEGSAEAWAHALPAALQDAWVAFGGGTDRRVPVRLTGTKVDVQAGDQPHQYDGTTQTPT